MKNSCQVYLHWMKWNISAITKGWTICAGKTTAQMSAQALGVEGNQMNTVVALRGQFSAVFPELNTIKEGQDRIPGRELADFLHNGLKSHGFEVSEIENVEPLFSIKCKSGQLTYEILVSLYDPDAEQPIWVIECPCKLGILAKLMGKKEDEELRTILAGIYSALSQKDKVWEMRWFKNLPAEPYSEVSYDLYPWGQFP